MSAPKLSLDSEDRHPLWVPNQVVPYWVVNDLILRRTPGSAVEGSSDQFPCAAGLGTVPLLWDVIRQALHDYQAVQLPQDDGLFYFPFAFGLEEGMRLDNLAGGQHQVTKVRLNPGGSPHWNPFYSQICGQLVRLQPAPAFDAVLRLPEKALLYYTEAFPREQLIAELDNGQLLTNFGLASRVLHSRPFASDGGASAPFGRRAHTNLEDPRSPDHVFEVLVFEEETRLEFTVFASSSWVADHLLRYLHAVLHAYAPLIKAHGVDNLRYEERGEDDHLSRGAERWPYKSDIHTRRTRWIAKTAEAMISSVRKIDRLKISATTPQRRGLVHPEGVPTDNPAGIRSVALADLTARTD